jgi:molecular chaperone GrpE
MVVKKKKKKEELEYMEEIDEEKGGAEIKMKIKKLKDELKKCKKEKNEYLKGWQKERADFINYRKEEDRTLGHKEDALKIDIISEFLPILDNLERAEKDITKELKNDNWVKGILGIKDQIKSILKEEGVEEIKDNKIFNPEIHEAVATGKGKENEILEVFQKGYFLNGKVLRPAKVKVGQK